MKKKLVLLAATLGLGFIGLEILVRVAGMDAPLVWQPHPRLGWWHIPNAYIHWRDEGDGHVQINSQGMRDVERSVARVPDVFRIAIFGDSMTEAVQVDLEQTFEQLLEGQLSKPRSRVEVLNFGVNGYSPLQEYLLFHELGKSFSPDLVIHAVFADNDIGASDPQLAVGQVGAPFVRQGSPSDLQVDYSRAEESYRSYEQQPTHFIRRWSALYRTIGRIRRQRAGADEVRVAVSENAGVPKRYQLYADPTAPKWDAAWSVFERIETAFAAEVRSAGAKFLVLSVPAGQVVDDGVWAHVKDVFPALRNGAWNLAGPGQRLAEIAERLNVPEMDALPAFRSANAGGQLFFSGDGHMTPAGHIVMSRFLADELRRHGLVPAGQAMSVLPGRR